MVVWWALVGMVGIRKVGKVVDVWPASRGTIDFELQKHVIRYFWIFWKFLHGDIARYSST